MSNETPVKSVPKIFSPARTLGRVREVKELDWHSLGNCLFTSNCACWRSAAGEVLPYREGRHGVRWQAKPGWLVYTHS